MVHRGVHREARELVTPDKKSLKKAAIQFDDKTKNMASSHVAVDEERDNLIKLSITECSTTSADEREGPPLEKSAAMRPAEHDTASLSASLENKSSTAISKKQSVLWTLARMILLDTPLLLVFCSFMLLCWVHHVHDNYLVKQLEAATWTGERDLTDQTYYHRHCDSSDLTTTDPLDLYLPDDATPDDAYQHQLRHGFTIFPGVLSQETCKDLRDHVVSKNRNLTKDESIWLIEWDNRLSFSLGTEELSVSKAVMELTSNQRLKKSMAKILGDNPALIELTSITSGFGAKAQEFHHDGRVNLAQYGRGVSHAYSIFIQLQNTTMAGGATGACPGTHYCAAGLEQVCEEYGVQPVNQDGYVAAGDAMVMNMDRYLLCCRLLFCLRLLASDRFILTNAVLLFLLLLSYQLASRICSYRP